MESQVMMQWNIGLESMVIDLPERKHIQQIMASLINLPPMKFLARRVKVQQVIKEKESTPKNSAKQCSTVPATATTCSSVKLAES